MKLKMLIAILFTMLLSISQSFAQKGHGGGRHHTGTGHIKNSKKTDPSNKAVNNRKTPADKKNVKQPANKKKKD